MDWGKLDAALAAALPAAETDDATAPAASAALGEAGKEGPLAVFVVVSEGASPADRERLAELGVTVPAPEAGPATATLTPSQVALLSDDPVVRRIALARRLRPLR